MVLTRFREPFSDPDWLFEVKNDGFRALAYSGRRLPTRLPWRNHVYKTFATLCQSIVADLDVEDAVLDGEIVCLGRMVTLNSTASCSSAVIHTFMPSICFG